MQSVFRQSGLFKVASMNDPWKALRRHSKGWMEDPAAKVHVSIMFGPGFMVTPAFVAKHNITHVINCAQESDSPQWFRDHNPTKYKCIHAIDSKDVNITEWYSLFANTMNKFLADPESIVVFVHCQCGINRSTVKMILAQRPCALTNPVFRQQLINFIKSNGRSG